MEINSDCTATILRPEGSGGNEHRLFGKPTGRPLTQGMPRLRPWPPKQTAGARGRRGPSPARRQPRLCRSESRTPPPGLLPRTNHHHPSHCGTARPSPPAHALAAALLLHPPTPTPTPATPSLLAPRLPRPRLLLAQRSWLPDLPPAAPAAAAGGRPRGCGWLPAGGRHSQSCSVPLHQERGRGKGEKQRW